MNCKEDHTTSRHTEHYKLPTFHICPAIRYKGYPIVNPIICQLSQSIMDFGFLLVKSHGSSFVISDALASFRGIVDGINHIMPIG